jgi:hypothetical protein
LTGHLNECAHAMSHLICISYIELVNSSSLSRYIHLFSGSLPLSSPSHLN